MQSRFSVWNGLALACAVAVSGFFCPEARAQEVPAERLALAVGVAEAMHSANNFRELMMASRSGFIMAVRQGGYDEPAAARIWELYVEEVDAGTPTFIRQAAEAYARAFTDQELRELQAFFESPTGQTFTRRQVGLVQAGQQAGAALGVAAGMRAEQRYHQELAAARDGPT